MFKFIFALAGLLVFGNFLGAFLGFAIGSLIDSMKIINLNSSNGGDVFDYYRQHTSRSSENFATMLMALSAAVMKADGRPLKVELEYIKNFFAQQFGTQYAHQHLQTLKHFLGVQQIPLEQICGDIRARTQVEVRIQLLHYLFGIARADGHVA